MTVKVGWLLGIAFAERLLITAADVTFSPRIATGHSEPSYSKDIDCTLRNGTGIFDGVAVAQGVCNNIASWKGG